ncbi:MAG: TonB-dependent receptor, partial [Acidobacteriota bacterium]
LGRLPGVATSDGSARMNVRGGNDDELMFILDGLELYEPFHLRDRQDFLSIIDSRTIGGLQFFGGGFPAEYGGRMSGVIEMDSLAPSDELKSGITVSTDFAGVVNQGSFFRDRGHWLVAGRRGNPSHLLDAVGADMRYETRYHDLFGSAGVDLSLATRLSFHFLTAHDKVEGPDGMPIGGSGRSESFQSEYDNNYAWVKLQSVWKPGWLSETQFSTGTLVQNRLGYSPSQSRLDDQRVTDILGLKQEFAFEGKRNFFRWGVDLKDLRAEYRYLAAPVDPGDGDDLLIYRQPSGQEYGLYFSDRIRVSHSLNIDVGVRWDRETYTAFEDETVSPRINLAYSPGSRSTLRAGWGYFHQPQKIHELQVEDGVGDFFPTQRSEHFTLGFDHGFRNGLELTVNAYRKNMTDLRPRYENLFDPFGFFPEADQDRVRIAPDRAEARGIEFLLGRPAGDRFSWWAGYTLASVEDEIDGDWIPRSWDQRHTLDLGLHFRLGESWNFGVTGSYHSGRPTTQMTAETAELPDGTLEIVPVLGPRNAERYPAFHSMDLRVDRIFPFRQMDFRLFLNITNIYGRRNICCVESFDYTVQPDGSVLVDPREVFGLPSLISFGLTWTF